MDIDVKVQPIRDSVMLGRALAERRAASGLTQAALAEAVGTYPDQLSRIELGHATAQLDLVFQVLRELGLELQVQAVCER
jgi:HTH-type transcriptional regulator/antitoxin HipB